MEPSQSPAGLIAHEKGANVTERPRVSANVTKEPEHPNLNLGEHAAHTEMVKTPTVSEFGKNVEMLPVQELEKFQTHDRRKQPWGADMDELKADIEKNGIKEPLLIGYNHAEKKAVLWDGNHRLGVAKELGIKELPVRVESKDYPTEDYGKPVAGYQGEGEVPEHLKPSDIGIGARPVKTESKEEQPTKYKFGNTQANIPAESEAAKALDAARARISNSDLKGDGKDQGSGGNHVTVRYGIKGEDTAGIRKFLSQQAPFEATLGKTDKFPPSEHSDGAAVIIAPVESPELHRLNAELEKHGDFTEPSFKEYKPHATVAYVDPGKADRYVGMAVTEGKKFTINQIAISKKDGSQEVVKLEGVKQSVTSGETNRSPVAANVTKQTETEKAIEKQHAPGREPGTLTNRDKALEGEIKHLRDQAAKVSEQFSLKSLSGYDPFSPLLKKYNDLLSEARAKEDELAKLRGEPTRSEKRTMQEKEATKNFTDRPAKALAYGDPKQSQHWQVKEPDYVEKRFEQEIARYKRAIPEQEQKIKELGPKVSQQKRATEESTLQFWKKILADNEARDPHRAQKFKEEYRKLVKESVSHGRPVPQEVIDQLPEFKLAQDARERYEKGLHTSFANRSAAINDTMQKEQGFKVKRQDGKPITEEQIKEISTGVDEMVKVLGPELRDMMRGTDLTISHTSGKHPFLSDAGGQYHPLDRSISAGINNFLGKPIKALAHETGHWLDFEAGRVLNSKALIRPKSGGPSTETKYVSEADRSTKPLYELARRTMSDSYRVQKLIKTTKLSNLPSSEREEIEVMKVVLGPYWHEARELWARMFEQYIATKLGSGGVSVRTPEQYQAAPAYWTKEAWTKLEPLFEEALKTRMDAMRERYAPTTIKGESQAGPTPPPTGPETPAQEVAPLYSEESARDKLGRSSSVGKVLTSTQFLERFHADPEAMTGEYLSQNTGPNGEVYISADRARHLFPEYASSKEGAAANTESTNKAASAIASAAFDRVVRSGSLKGKAVVFVAGMPGAGKSSAENAFKNHAGEVGMFYEGNLSDNRLLERRVKAVLDSGATPTVVYVYAPRKTALERMISRAGDIGRYVPIEYGARVAADTPRSIDNLYERYGDRVQYAAIDNSGASPVVLDGIDAIRKLAENRSSDEIRDEQLDHAKALRAQGKLSDELYDRIRPQSSGSPDRGRNGGEHKEAPTGSLGSELIHGESGAANVFKPLQAAATLSGTVGEYVRSEAHLNKIARELHAGMYDLEAAHSAQVLRAVQVMEKAKEEFGDKLAADAEAVYHHLENPEEPLNSEQDSLLDDTVIPIMEQTDKNFIRLKELLGQEAELIEHYVHRQVSGKGGWFDRITSGATKGAGRGNLLSKTAPQTKGRTMMALEADNVAGRRVVVAIKGNRVTAFKHGKTEDMGALSSGLTTKYEIQDKRLDSLADRIIELQKQIASIPGEDKTKRLTAIDSTIAELRKERDILSEVKGRKAGKNAVYGTEVTFGKRKAITEKIDELEKERARIQESGHMSNAGEERVRRLKESLKVVENERNRVLESVPTDQLLDSVWVDKNGKRWRITQATTKEIEANTDLTYYHDGLASALVSNLQVTKALRGAEFIEAFKESPEFGEIAFKQGSGNPPDGWRSTLLPQMRDYYFEPHVAEVLDWYADRIRGKDSSIWDKVGQFLRTSIFFNPLIHIPNISVHWIVERGITGYNPLRFPEATRAGLKAINAVIHQNEDFLAALDVGAPLQSHREDTAKITQLFFDQLSGGLEKKEDWALDLAKRIGMAPVDLIKGIYRFSGKATWVTNDIAMLQSAYEKQARTQGMSLKEALRETAKHIPDYRLPARMFNSRALAKLLSNPNISMFMAYHYGAAKSYGEAAKSALGIGGGGGGQGGQPPEPTGASGEEGGEAPKGRSKAAEVAHGWEILATIGLVTFVLYPLLDKLVQELTGDKHAKLRRAGAATIPYNVYLAATKQKSIGDVVQSVATPAVQTKSAAELLVNRDFYTGRNIYDPTADAETQARQVGRFLMEAVSPISQGSRMIEGGAEARKRFAWGLVGVAFPKSRAERLAQQLAMQRFGTKAETPKDREDYVERREILNELRKGNRQPLDRARAKHEITPRQVHNIERRAKLTPLQDSVHGLSYAEAREVYSVATDDEKKSLDQVMHQKRMNMLKAHRGPEVVAAESRF